MNRQPNPAMLEPCLPPHRRIRWKECTRSDVFVAGSSLPFPSTFYGGDTRTASRWFVHRVTVTTSSAKTSRRKRARAGYRKAVRDETSGRPYCRAAGFERPADESGESACRHAGDE